MRYTLARNKSLKFQICLRKSRVPEMLLNHAGLTMLNPPPTQNRKLRQVGKTEMTIPEWKSSSPTKTPPRMARDDWERRFDADFNREIQGIRSGMRCQGFEETFSSMKDVVEKLKNVRTFDVPARFYFHLEGACLLATGVFSCTNVAGGVAHICEFARSMSGDSVAALVRKYLMELSWVSQADGEDWLATLRQAKNNWKMVLENRHFRNVQTVLSTMVSLGLCESAQVAFSICGVRLFTQKVLKKQSSAIDLVDAVLTTIMDFVEGGFECFRHGSIKPLIVGDIEIESLEKECNRLETLFEYARTGNLADCESGLTEQEYFKQLENCIGRLSEAKQIARGAISQKLLQNKYDTLCKQKVQFERSCNKAGLRVAPWSILIYGNSGVGKSSVANILMIASLKSNGFPAEDEYLITNQEHDKYDSSLKSYCTGLFFDDMCNTKLNFAQTAPTANLIQTVNNVRSYGNMAALEEKGKVLKEPKVVCITTNVKNLKSTEQSECPLSIERRNAYILTVTVKHQFSNKDGQLNPDKVKQWYIGQLGMKKVPPVPDLWLFRVETAVGVRNPTPGRPDIVTYVPVVFEGKPLIDVGIDTLLRYNRDMSAKHFEHQKVLVENQTNLSAKMDWCQGCRMPGAMCLCNELKVNDDVFHSLPTVRECAEEGEREKRSLTSVQGDAKLDAEIADEELDHHQIRENAEALLASCSNIGEMEEQFGAMISKFAISMYCTRSKQVQALWDRFGDRIESATVDLMEKRLEMLENSVWCRWTNWIPKAWLDHEETQQIILWAHADELSSVVRLRYMVNAFLGTFCVCVIMAVPWNWTWLLLRLVFLAFLGKLGLATGRIYETEKLRLYARINAENGAMNVTFRKYRDEAVAYITSGCLILGSLYAFTCIWKHVRAIKLETQGNLTPSSMQDVESRDEEAVIESQIAKEQGWQQAHVTPLPCSEKSKTATPQQLANKVFGNLTQFTWVNDAGNDAGCDMFFIQSNIAVIPNHIWKKDDMPITIRRGNTKIQSFKAIISRRHSVAIPDTDLCLVYVANAGDWSDLTHYLPLAVYEQGRNIPAKFVYKEMRNTVPERKECDTMVRYEEIAVTGQPSYPGARYELGFATFSGLCMGTLVGAGRESVILGFHTAGVTGAHTGGMSCLIRAKYETAKLALAEIPGVTLAASTGVMQHQVYGAPIVVNNKIHDKSPVNRLPEDAHVDVYGTCTGRAKYYSKVTETLIADTVSEICGVEKLFDKPKFHLGDAFEKSLFVSCRPSIGVEPSLLIPAVADYVSHMIAKIRGIPELVEGIKPLTRMENVAGKDGVRFIDKLNPNSSIGYPLSGPKSRYIELLDPDDYPDFSCPAQLEERFWTEMERMEQEYLASRRCHVPFKACLKDEPTLKTKDKVRVFQAAPVALQLIIRKYFLPLVRLLSVFPLDSECGVGINTMGPEWHDLVEHMRKHGTNRIFAGDYSKYDLRMPAQLILAAFDVLIIIAKEFGYTDDDITIMRGIATDVAYPVMAYNGDLVQHFGSNPSGQNLTVYINSIVNSLLLRCAFYDIVVAEKWKPFREVASVMTYGDDVKGSIAIGYDEFNHISYAKFLSDRDIVFTMPDKESVPTEYMNDADADFLKRKNVYAEELKLWVGALDEKSIFKSITSVLDSKVLSPEEQSAQNIDGALREWFFYGRDHYEMRREQMRQVATKHGLQDGCSMLGMSYNACVAKYRERYGLETPIPEGLEQP